MIRWGYDASVAAISNANRPPVALATPSRPKFPYRFPYRCILLSLSLLPLISLPRRHGRPIYPHGLVSCPQLAGGVGRNRPRYACLSFVFPGRLAFSEKAPQGSMI